MLRPREYTRRIRRFFASASAYTERLRSCQSLTCVSDLVKSLSDQQLSPAECIYTVARCSSLKKVNDPTRRGLVPTNVSFTVSESVLRQIDAYSINDLVSIVVGMCDGNRSADEYLMYRVARRVTQDHQAVSVTDLCKLLRVFCKRDLLDEELIDVVISRLVQSSSKGDTPTLKQLITSFRLLSELRVRSDSLFRSILAHPGMPKIQPKEATALLIAMAELDFTDTDIADRLWTVVERDTLIRSHDDEFGLLWSHLVFPRNTQMVGDIINRASSENRMRKRIQLLQDCKRLGITEFTQRGEILAHSTRSRKEVDSTDSVSSGMHLEVAHVLTRMGRKPVLEVPASSFIVDIALSSG